jgi:hypothetical protein
MSSFEERQMVEKNESRIDNLFALFERLNEREDPSEDVSLNTERIAQLEAEVERLREIVHDQSKMGKIEQIEEAALNKSDSSMEGVVMTYKEIMAATGVSHTQAYRYIEELPRDYDRFMDRDDQDKTRGLIVDLSRVRTKTSD